MQTVEGPVQTVEGPGPAQSRCAVLGSPISHSLSPVLHAAAYTHLGLDWHYGRYEVHESGLSAFLAGLDRSWRGLSLTMPLKQVALRCLDQVSVTAVTSSAVNTVLIRADGHRYGDNTDVPGIVAALREAGVSRVPTASVLGAGATARSALVALAELADGVVAYARTPERADDLLRVAAALGLPCQVRPWPERQAGLTAPLVLLAAPSAATADLALAAPSRPGLLFDVAYDPWPTPVALAWLQRGAKVVSGLDLLVHQAVRQVQLMTGGAVPVDVLRAALADRTPL